LHLEAVRLVQSELAKHSTQLPPLHKNPDAQSSLTLHCTHCKVDVEQCLLTALDAQLASVVHPTQVLLAMLHLGVDPEH